MLLQYLVAEVTTAKMTKWHRSVSCCSCCAVDGIESEIEFRTLRTAHSPPQRAFIALSNFSLFISLPFLALPGMLHYPLLNGSKAWDKHGMTAKLR